MILAMKYIYINGLFLFHLIHKVNIVVFSSSYNRHFSQDTFHRKLKTCTLPSYTDSPESGGPGRTPKYFRLREYPNVCNVPKVP